MSDLNTLLGLDPAPVSPAAAAAISDLEVRVAALEGRCSVLLALLNSELAPKGYAAAVRATGTVVVGPADAVG